MRALELGWREDQVVVIDCDLGESGTADREGFRHLMAEVGLGHAGIVLGLEVSRLARDNIDWHRLLEVCATTNTLILDEDGLYSPQDHNDRLLLGLKGAMSAAELHILRSRLRGGILSQAQRNDPATPNREKKRMIRLLIEDVTLTRHGDHAHVGVRLRGGATRELDISLQAAEHPAKLPAAIVAEIGELLRHYTDAQVADILNRRGPTGSRGQPFNTSMVAHVRFRRRLESQRQMLRKNGMLTTAELAEQLSISHDRVRALASKGIIRRRGASQTRFLYEPPGQDDPVWKLVNQGRRENSMANSIQNGMEA